ncbi:hypothetical protein [Tanticharoenia sakaeratensis]|uniref:Uncharacterized protein n=1 Tax=Tanticharoenia sakaeratensis NBRC 103193 TaxID=1231623 RepID=A0A0D6MI03_9PROT|nr:hypothetical protein [Tanticharoenia sakaeratensis]GAN53105.1 hypothetical protein Tasa_005_020 [Tanticharoenia sakaeratensis NBRC 103193]GBQ20524.1 hypothetical protein AA103193_1409 [Tanticharoenia sakaeratensis NBRC 103193]
MTFDEFTESLSRNAPPVADPALAALWWAGRNDWDQAHEIVQAHEGEPSCDLVHAWLHRREGDPGNARYWYRRAGVAMSASSVADEWGEIVNRLLLR